MQNEALHKGQRIARNTMMLYVRMFVLMLVGLYTSRVVLNALGETDYGIYSVVGGVVAMFTMISGALNSLKMSKKNMRPSWVLCLVYSTLRWE